MSKKKLTFIIFVNSLFGLILTLTQQYSFLSLDKISLESEVLPAPEQDEGKYKENFERFKKKFNKFYAELDEQKRYENYKANYKKAAKIQAKSNRATPHLSLVLGETPISDLSEEELLLNILTFRPDNIGDVPLMEYSTFKSSEPTTTSFITIKAEKKQSTLLPDSYDLRQLGLTSIVKNQGSCGCCWAFATSSVVESLYLKSTGISYIFSIQQQINCNYDQQYGNWGCNGGIYSKSFDYVIRSGLTLESNYPYTQLLSKCAQNKILNTKKIYKYYSWNVSNNEQIMAEILFNYGAAAVAIEASKLVNYKSGIIDPSVIGCSNSVNHAVVLVGYGYVIDANGQAVQYWIIQNSWSTAWGENGFFRILKGQRACGIDTMMYTLHLS